MISLFHHVEAPMQEVLLPKDAKKNICPFPNFHKISMQLQEIYINDHWMSNIIQKGQ